MRVWRPILLGERTIVVASVDDTVGEIVGRVSRTGLPVTLCVRAGSSSMTVATIRELEPGEHATDPHSVAPKANLGMFISYLWKMRTFTSHVEEPAGAEYELEFA